jgi:osmoprotectant transport system ATP-binding protein
MIVFENAGKSYGGVAVVDDVTMTVESGAFVAFVGPSGAGKSTLIRMVNALVRPDRGRILFDGEDVARADPVALRRRFGYAIQSTGLFPHWTVARNIATVPHLLGWPRRRIADRVDELLHLVELPPGEYRDRYPAELSGGQQQRVGVARALAADPHALLMDEPFGALDAVTRGALQTQMAEIHKATGKTVLMVTHDVDEAIRLASRIAVMEGGRLVQYAEPAELLAAPATPFVSALFGGEEAGIRLLKVTRVAARAIPAEGTVPAQAIAADATLEAALARMLADRVDTLAVERTTPPRVIRLADIVRGGR